MERSEKPKHLCTQKKLDFTDYTLESMMDNLAVYWLLSLLFV